MLEDFKDLSKGILHKFASRLGEGSNILPDLQIKSELAKSSLNLDMPSIKSILPYESVDDDLFFINKNSVGFGLHLMPAAGADEVLVKSMAELLKNKLPIGVDCTVMLYRHHYLSETLKNGFEPMINEGGIYERLALINEKYHLKAAQDGYANGRNIAAQLSDYRVYLFFSARTFEKINNLRENIESELSVAGLHHARIEQQDFLSLMRALLAPQLNNMQWPDVAIDENLPLSHIIPAGNSLFSINDLNIDYEGSDKEGHPYQTRIINCHIEKWPKELALWQTPDLFANLLHPEHGIPCSFLISLTVRGVNQDKMLARAKNRAKSLNANANQIQHFLNPGSKDESDSWNFIHEEGSRDNLSLLPMFYNVVLFTKPEQEREVVAKTISSYRQLGFELQQSRATGWVRYLASLPFFMTEGFFKDFEALGLIKTMTHYNIANLMPIVADFKGSRSGLLIPTHRNQIFYLNTFDNKNLPITNFNFLTVGSSGAGKSMFQQAQILSGIALGEITYVIDLGHSYKHLCELVGGTYIDVTNITLNPFTLFDFEGKTEVQTRDGKLDEVTDSIQIRDLLAIMASPHVPVCDVQKSYLLDAATTCWQSKGRSACIDDVLDALRQRAAESNDDSRLNDLVILLKKYGRDGVYGHLFNGDTPFVNKSKLVVFEMGGFQHDHDLLTIVMFVMIIIIQGQFYQSDRGIKKRCIIDEAWRFLTSGSNPIAAQFIEQGFRTARKHNGGFGVITQYLLDTEKTIQGQAIAASSDIKIIMRQGNFKEYVRDYPNRFNPFQQKMIESFGDVVGGGFSNLMIETGSTYSFHRYFADPYTKLLFSSSGDEFGEIEAKMAQGFSIDDAIYQVLQSRQQ